jgi:hypothetical protein
MNFFNVIKDIKPILRSLEQRSGVKSSVGKYKVYWKVPYFLFIQRRFDLIKKGHFDRKRAQICIQRWNRIEK